MKLKKHIPNILTSLRLFSPFILTPLIISGNYFMAFTALCSFLTTDALDGYLARKWQVQSELGAKLDAFADKLILLSLLVPLLINNPFILINLGLEGVISFVNVKRKLLGGKPRTLQIGRVKMVILSLFMALSYLNVLVLVPKIILNLFYITTIILQLKSLQAYFNEMKKEKKIKINNDKMANSLDKVVMSKEKNKVLDKDLLVENIELQKLENAKLDLINLKNTIDIANNSNNKDGFCKVKKDNKHTI